jgi:hypothetical protein
MGAAKRLDGNYPDKQYLDKGEREGWVTVQEISMKRIIVDPAYQARDIPTKSPIGISVNMNHVKELAAIRDMNNGEFLTPIVVFLAPDGRFLLADGFHRYEENRQRRGTSIRAFVVKSNDYEHEARLFSAMCNRQMCLHRTKADEKKAAEILFADPMCREWSNKRLADHIGVYPTTIKYWKLEYESNNKIKFPETYVGSDGVKRKSRHTANGRPSISRTTYGYSASIHGKTVHLGTNIETSEKKLEDITSLKKNKRKLLDNTKLREFLVYRKILSTLVSIPTGIGTIGFCKTSSSIFISLNSVSLATFTEAIGILHLARIYSRMAHARLVIVCYVEDISPVLVELARQDGIEFFTPEGLVANLKGTEPQEEKEPEGDLPCT